MSQEQYDIFGLMAPEDAEEFKPKPKTIGTTMSAAQHANEKKGLQGEYKQGWEEAVGESGSGKTVAKAQPTAKMTGKSVTVDKTAEYLSYKKWFCYAGHQILIEDPSLTMEEIRKRMVKTFPEVSKERTEMTYTPPELPKKKKGTKGVEKLENQAPLDFQETTTKEEKTEDADKSVDIEESSCEQDANGSCEGEAVTETESMVEETKKGSTENGKVVLLPSIVDGVERFGMVVPILKGAKKGSIITEGDLERRFSKYEDLLAKPTVRNLLIGHNGLYEVRITPVGIFKARLTDEATKGAEIVKEGVDLYVPPIPLDLFLTIRDFFVRFSELETPLEAMTRIYYDGQSYFAYVPHQVVTRTSVDALDYPEDLEVEANNTLVMEVHSHNVLPSWFSQTDDRDEVATGLYCVWGNLDQLRDKNASLSVRFSCGGHYRELKIIDFVKDTPSVKRHLPNVDEMDGWMSKVNVLGGETIG